MSDKKSIALSKAADGIENTREKKPELLCPAGSPAAFDAAIEGGADAIYLGGSAFNARINAKNFSADEMKDAICKAHSYGTKVYIAANTLIFDRETENYLRAAEDAYLAGADALIVADLGAAALLRRYIPELELHASTQLSGHNTSAAKKLAELGFSRMVCAREMSADDLRSFVAESPIEAEVFVHGALCVCHSGQCLFSSMVGGRSGNRGECAQPCRLPYKTPKGKNQYPLSLKDLCLATHIRELCDMGIASFKIEGRMKSPEYVRDVCSIWRRLIDEGRNASKEEMLELERIFSRGGFTDGYYTRRISQSMMGVRSEDDKRTSRELVPFDKITRKIPVDLEMKVKEGEPISLTAKGFGVTVLGDIPEKARTAPLDAEAIRRCISKLGSTPYELRDFELELDDGLMLPVSKLNALRREATDKMLAENTCRRTLPERAEKIKNEAPTYKRENSRSAVFYKASSLTEKATEYFDIIYLPLDEYDQRAKGVLLPAVIYDSERGNILKMLKNAKQNGAEHALVSNIGHLELVREAGLTPHGDLRLNVTNNETARQLEELGLSDFVLSPELSLSQMRDIGGRSFCTVYGRIPLMVTEKCVAREISDCQTCKTGKVRLVDRKNAEFPVLKDISHRSVIFNSVPTYMADRRDELDRAGITMRHFIFSDESASEVDDVIERYEKGLPLDRASRRM